MNLKLFPLLAAIALAAGQSFAEERVVLDGDTEDCALYRALNTQDAMPADCQDSKAPFEDTSEPQPVILKRVSFDFNSRQLSPAAQTDLARVARIMSNPVSVRQRYELGGHTDSLGDAGYNLILSKRRAQAVRHYLVGLGVPAERLDSEGYGSKDPLPRHRPYDPANRRVEVVNLKHPVN